MDTQRPEDSVAFEIRPQGLALQAPASSGSQASFLDCAEHMFFFGGPVFPGRSAYDVNVLYLWSRNMEFPGPFPSPKLGAEAGRRLRNQWAKMKTGFTRAIA